MTSTEIEGIYNKDYKKLIEIGLGVSVDSHVDNLLISMLSHIYALGFLDGERREIKNRIEELTKLKHEMSMRNQ